MRIIIILLALILPLVLASDYYPTTIILQGNSSGSASNYTLDVAGNYGAGIILDTDTFNILGGNGILAYMSGDTLTINKTNQSFTDTTIQNCSVDLSCSDVCYDSEIDTLITDIWVNESGDRMTGNLDLGTNDLVNVSDITNYQAINIKPNGDESDYFEFTTISDIPTITTIGGIDLDIIGDTTTMRVNVEESTGTNWLTFATTSTGTPYSWFYSKEPFRVYSNGDNDDYTLYTTQDNVPKIETGNINATYNITASRFCITLNCSSYITHNGTHTIIQT